MHKPSTRKMSDAHEEFLHDLLGPNAIRMPNSGAGWAKQMDVRGKHTEEKYAFAIDGKSTFGESIGVSKAMWEKAQEQAANEIPALALRFYDTWRLDVGLDLIVISADDFAILLDEARSCTGHNKTEDEW